jgi:acetyl esterase/lipase
MKFEKFAFSALILIISLVFSSCASPRPDPTSVVEPATKEPTGTAFDPTSTTPPYRIERDIEYVPGGGAYQSLDVYLPTVGEGPFPTILAIHGGGFRARSKSLYLFIGKHFAGKGYAFVSTNYRLSQKASYPAQVEDVFCALSWIHANQDVYGFDPEQIYVWGGSAGAYLAGMLGTVNSTANYLKGCPHELPESNLLAGMILFYGFYDFTKTNSLDAFPEHSIENDLEPYWGASYAELAPDRLAEMSPMSWIDGDDPPALLIHGTKDAAVATWMSDDFSTALNDAGVVTELVLIDAGHAFELEPLSGPEMSRSLEAIDSFLTRVSESNTR